MSQKSIKISTGRSFRLRNGARVKVITRREVTAAPFTPQEPYVFFVGILDGCKQRYTWSDDGRYSPVADGPLDIVGPG